MKIVVIGANGQLGSDICFIFKKKFEVIELLQTDIEITNNKSIEKALAPYKGDIILNTAAYHHLKQCEENPEIAYAVNAIGTRDLARWCLKNDSTFIHVSTDYVFDGNKRTPYIDAGIEGYTGCIRTVQPFNTPCLQCWPTLLKNNGIKAGCSTDPIPSTYFTASYASNIQVMQSLSLLFNQPVKPFISFDLQKGLTQPLNLKMNKECELCRTTHLAE